MQFNAVRDRAGNARDRYRSPSLSLKSLNSRLRAGRFGYERLEGLLGKIAVESADPLRFGHEGLESRLGVFRLDFNDLVERPHAGQFLDLAFGVFERSLGVVAIRGSNGLHAA